MIVSVPLNGKKCLLSDDDKRDFFALVAKANGISLETSAESDSDNSDE